MKLFLRLTIPSSSPVFTFLAACTLLATGACGTKGLDGRATFSSGSFGSVDTPLAAGATDSISFTVPSGTPVDHAASSDPTVLALGTVTSSGDASYRVPLTALRPGSVTLTIYDASSKEIDRTTIEVAAIASVQFSESSGLTVLEGGTFAVRATALDASKRELGGTGAIHYTYAGSVAGDSGGGLCSNDCAHFRAVSGGDGLVQATTPSASATLPLHVVPVTAIDSLTTAKTAIEVRANESNLVPYTLGSGGATVYAGGWGALTCTSSDETVAKGGDVASDLGASGKPSGVILVSGVAAGTATITCGLKGQKATLVVTVK